MKKHMLPLLLIPLLAACEQATQSTPAISPAPATPAAEGGAPPAPAPDPQQGLIRSLEWDDLIPADFRFDRMVKDLGIENLEDMEDDDPRAIELMEQVKVMFKKAPVVKALDGTRVRLPGFVVPLEGDGKVLEEFLLVPYYGACIHVPPPPANQTVLVSASGIGARSRAAFDTVWVTGILHTEASESELAEAGYRLSASQVEDYDE